MKLYLSSYKLGDKTRYLKDWLGTSKNNKIAMIPNAADAYNSGNDIIEEKRKSHSKLLSDLGFKVTVFDLKEYFGDEEKLEKDLTDFYAFFAVGGNTFVLREAMKLSGFDKYLLSLKDKDDYLYGGWSAGICVLAPSIKNLDIVDNPTANPYNTEIVLEGLGLVEYLPLPHYRSDHPESNLIEKEVKRAKKQNIAFRTLRDGEVIIEDTK